MEFSELVNSQILQNCCTYEQMSNCTRTLNVSIGPLYTEPPTFSVHKRCLYLITATTEVSNTIQERWSYPLNFLYHTEKKYFFPRTSQLLTKTLDGNLDTFRI